MTENNVEPGIEDRVLGLPGIAGLADKVPELLHDFYTRLAPRLILTPTARAILTAFGAVDVKAEKVAAILRENPYYEFHFMKQIGALSKRETLPSVEGAVVLLGMQKTRDLITALQLVRQVRSANPEWGTNGALKLAPDQVLRFAMATEEAFAPFKRDFTHIGYSAAAIYDLLMLLMEEIVPDANVRKRVIQYVDDSYRNAVKTVKVAVELARGLPDFAARRYLIPICLLHGLGRVVTAMLNPAYLDLLEAAASAGLSRTVVRHVEEKRFGIASLSLCSAALRSLQIFRSFDRAVLFIEQPYLLKSRDKNLYQLSSIVLLSANIAAQFQVPKGADDPVIAQWRGAELRDFKVDGRMLVDALPRVKL